MGNVECSIMLTDVNKLCGQVLIGPRDVAAQSKERIRSPISPPPDKKFNTVECVSADFELIDMNDKIIVPEDTHKLQSFLV
ncbi:hypothetical protein CHU_2083 [Cytophaga hutchinsonii ATCC 33406]|uniref:Uncharacterized protein n=1 Tax=Cytophaga hutchinsonii (strain ATCC 33406 / DSM 1761 / CIP 103989 / NBRC 15051 / NCIMB 9469 / D465) TaxID=269798 RepID=A0A6N4ST04_CYTH3|nr:hypothetical protein CHU_2083 [Cytophaga hutchinsonii ATCC 33406]